jgi:hypothetical protein
VLRSLSIRHGQISCCGNYRHVRTQVEPGHPDVRSSTVSGPGRGYASAGEEACFTVQARDELGNPCSSAGLQELLPLQVGALHWARSHLQGTR